MTRPLLVIVWTLLVAARQQAAAENGLKLTVYDNMGRVRSPGTKTSIISEPFFAVNSTEPMSAEIEGTITFDTAGVYQFNCTFSKTTTGHSHTAVGLKFIL